MAEISQPVRRSPLRGLFAGAGLGCVFFLIEGALILRGEVAGLNLDLRGPFAIVFDAVRPLLSGLLGRIALLYAAAGAVCGLTATVLTWAFTLRRRPTRAAVWLAEWLTVVALVCAYKGIWRPALFDDLSALRAPLAFAVDHLHPWQALAALGLFGAVHLAVALARSDVRVVIARVARRPRAAAAVTALVVLAVAASVAVPRRPVRRDARLLVVIGVDAFRPDRLAINGEQRRVAPALDAFVREATLFQNAWTPIAQTEPAWRSLLTGRWPHRTGVRWPLTPDRDVVKGETFPAVLARSGVHTRFDTDCSRFHFETEASGFGERVQPPRGAINFLLEKLRFRGVGVFGDNALGAAWLPEMVDNRALAGLHDPIGYAERLADAWVARAQAGDALLAFHATAAHFPGDPVYPHYRRFMPPDAPLQRRLRMVYAPIGGPAKPGWSREGAEALYDELLSQADQQVGILLSRLEAAGLYEHATVVVFSDHGESFHADQPALSGAMPVHGARLQREENQILLAVKLPGQRRHAQVHDLVRLIDLGPTLLELAGAPPLEDADGESLLPLFTGEQRGAPRLLYAETGFTHAVPTAFDPHHRVGAARAFSAYAIQPDGTVEMSAEAGAATLQEKDVGAFDGEHWLIRAPQQDGTWAERCTGRCAELAAFLDRVTGGRHRSAARP